jgi:CheY-like chemotaxis protein
MSAAADGVRQSRGEGRMTIEPSQTSIGYEPGFALDLVAAGDEPHQNVAGAPRKTAVLVDRSSGWLEAVERLLKRLDITIVGTTASPERALRLVGKRKPDLLIAEIESNSPEDDRIACLRQAEERAPGLLTIALSISDDSGRIEMAIDGEASGWKRRPIDTPEELDDILLDWAADTDRGGRPREPRVSVVIPALNEAENLALLLPRLDPDLHEVLLVDGASQDGTLEVAQDLYPKIRTMTQTRSGKGNALCAGFEAATGDIIVMLDADGSADPAEIPAFVGALRSGADFAKGSRFLHGAGTEDMTLHRKLGNGAFVFLVRLLFGGRYSDLCYGYNAFWRDVLPALRLDCDGFEIETVMNIRALKARLKVVEVASFEGCRVYGTSNLRTIADGWRVLKTIFRERLAALPRADERGAQEEDVEEAVCSPELGA